MPNFPKPPSGRDRIFALIADEIGQLPGAQERRLLGVDGVDGSGKSMFADALAKFLEERGQSVVRISLDDFHHPRSARHARGSSSPEGFWLDSYNYQLLRDLVFDPLSNTGTGWFKAVGHDLESDEAVCSAAQFLPTSSIAVIDGMFLNRDEMRSHWYYSIFLDVPFPITAERMAARDGTSPDPTHPSMRRYVGGQQLYFAECDPAARATLVVDNTNPAEPHVLAPARVSYR